MSRIGIPDAAPGRGGGSRDLMLQMCKDGEVSEKQYDCAMGSRTNIELVQCFTSK